MTFADFDAPTEELIDTMRAAYDVEPEVDAVLVRKLRNRGNGPYTPHKLEELTSAVERLLADEASGDFEVSDARWFTGGASKLQMGFTLRWTDPERGEVTDRFMVRMDPKETLNATSKLREHQVVSLLQGRLPMPRSQWVDPDARWFPEPALVYTVVEGVTKPENADTGQVTGLGTNFGAELRAALGPQFLEHLAAIHDFTDFAAGETGALSFPEEGTTQAAAWKLDNLRRVWDEDRIEDLPLVDVAFNWMGRNLPVLDRATIVHGDYRSGNFLFDEPSARITAWLDWELAHVGDRHLDLAWATNPMFGHWSEDGSTYYVSGLMTLEEFVAGYEKASGQTVDRDRLHWYRVFNACDVLAKVLATSRRVVSLGKSHQDILLARVEGMIPGVTLELRSLLEEVL